MHTHTHTHTHSHTYTHTHTHAHTHTPHSLFLSHALSLSHTQTCTHTQIRTHSLTRSLYYTHRRRVRSAVSPFSPTSMIMDSRPDTLCLPVSGAAAADDSCLNILKYRDDALQHSRLLSAKVPPRFLSDLRIVHLRPLFATAESHAL
jgi:hypothetical protein